MIPDARVHWIGNRPYFGVMMLYPTQGKRRWLWQLYDQVGRKLGEERVPRKHDALVAIRALAGERGREDMKKDELMTEKCLNCGGKGSVREYDEVPALVPCPACDGEGRL